VLIGTPEGREIVKKEFGITIAKQGEDKPIVAILIPTHKKPENETGTALERMIPVAREVCHVVMRPSVASSVVHWVRNQLVSTLYKEKVPFDYVLFMDDDMVPPPEALNVLLGRNVDVIGAVCTVRQDPPLPNARYFNPEKRFYQTADIDRPGVWKVGAIGTGFMLISRKALEDIGEYTLSQRYFREYMGMSKEAADAREKSERERAAKDHNKFWFEFLKDPHSGEIGEDLSFCFKARECGYDIYGDSTFAVGHVGNYAFGLEDYWHYREEAVRGGLVVPLGSDPIKPKHEEYQIQVVEG
jgi:Glycosyltransferase like family 2